MVPALIPHALLATTPPMVATLALAGSGPMIRPCRADVILERRTVVPGAIRAQGPTVQHLDSGPVTTHIN
ncbi:hypothetical protein Shyhy01_16790 [Streptomyces hygroscopicus subsp. hygroscopicus]|nr:hypothetical protein Shyhy01_16790 [Streptomyces hygroscopicus subsp. hygroscopicus]